MSKIIEIAFIIVIIIYLIINILAYIIYKKLSQIENAAGLSGFEIARIVSSKLSSEELHIIKKKGLFLDYYDTNRKVIKLSPEVFDGTNMYASVLSLRIALETSKKQEQLINEKFCSFLVLVSYIIIILGGFLNNYNIIHFGFILFIITFLIAMFYINIHISENEMAAYMKIIKKEKIIQPLDNLNDDLILICIISLARLPYAFINYFR